MNIYLFRLTNYLSCKYYSAAQECLPQSLSGILATNSLYFSVDWRKEFETRKICNLCAQKIYRNCRIAAERKLL
jgi:hypothetical protein